MRLADGPALLLLLLGCARAPRPAEGAPPTRAPARARAPAPVPARPRRGRPGGGPGGGAAPSGNASASALLEQVERKWAQWEEEGFLVLEAALSQRVMASYRRRFDAFFNETRAGAYEPWVFADQVEASFRIQGASGPWNDGPSRVRLLCPMCSPASDFVSRLIYQPAVLEVARRLIGAPPRGLRRQQALLFRRGSEQKLHLDSWYGMAGSRRGGMVSMSFTIDDAGDDNGAIVYVPGTHRWWPEATPPGAGARDARAAPPRWQRMQVDDRGQDMFLCAQAARYRPQAKAVRLRAGDVAVWHEMTLHGGMPVAEPCRTRRSIVTQYKDWD